jgi:membrane protein YqaA with SNARE-associated domain
MHERMSVSRQPEPEKVVFLEQSRAAFDRWEGFARSRAGLAVLFVWALAEATVWPTIPDALLVPMVVGARRAFPRLWLAAVTGSTLGVLALYLFALQAPGVALDLLKQLPAVRPEMLGRAAGLLAEQGPRAFLIQPLTGIPVKIFAVLGAGQGLDPWHVMPISIAARAFRMGVSGGVSALLAWRLRRFLRDFSLLLAVAYLVLFGYGWWATQM